MNLMYCGTCRTGFKEGEFSPARPPYSVIHLMTEPPQHVHPITRELLVSAS